MRASWKLETRTRERAKKNRGVHEGFRSIVLGGCLLRDMKTSAISVIFTALWDCYPFLGGRLRIRR